MPLVKETLKATILAVLVDMSNRTDDREKCLEDYADGMATAIDAYIKTATVTVAVTTAGSATNQAGTGTGTLS